MAVPEDPHPATPASSADAAQPGPPADAAGPAPQAEPTRPGPPVDAVGPEAAGAAELVTRLHLHHRLVEVERALAGAGRRVTRGGALPAWLRQTPGESRWSVAIVMVVAIGLQLMIPDRLAVRPNWLLPAAELALLALLIAASPRRLDRDERWIRYAGITLVALATAANAWSAYLLIRELLLGRGGSGPALLGVGAAIWLTNVIIFALWYWEYDRGGAVARSKAIKTDPDFLFPQMQNPDLAPEHWEPTFLDYLYVSFTNATAFSPTDTMPLSRWAKMLMLGQACVSLATVALVIARAVNILH